MVLNFLKASLQSELQAAFELGAILQGCSDDSPLVLLSRESVLGKPMYFQVHWGKST